MKWNTKIETHTHKGKEMDQEKKLSSEMKIIISLNG